MSAGPYEGKSSKDRGWEITDASVAPLVWLAASLALATIITFFLNTWLIDALNENRESENGDVHPMAEYRLRPETYLLQDTEMRRNDIAKYREEQDAAMTSHDWIDPISGNVRIPVEDAMSVMLRDDQFPQRPDGGE